MYAGVISKAWACVDVCLYRGGEQRPPGSTARFFINRPCFYILVSRLDIFWTMCFSSSRRHFGCCPARPARLSSKPNPDVRVPTPRWLSVHGASR